MTTLRNADLIACETPAVTRELLDRSGIRGQRNLVMHHDRGATGARVLEPLRRGRSVALVSDAGMPVISDPGYQLVRAAHHAQVPVRVVPGPSAIVSAVAASGFPGKPFTFLGFPPKGGAGRGEFLRGAQTAHGAVVVTESPKRVGRLLKELSQILGARAASLSWDLTKVTETHWDGTLGQLADRAEREARDGQLTLVIEPGDAPYRGR